MDAGRPDEQTTGQCGRRRFGRLHLRRRWYGRARFQSELGAVRLRGAVLLF